MPEGAAALPGLPGKHNQRRARFGTARRKRQHWQSSGAVANAAARVARRRASLFFRFKTQLHRRAASQNRQDRPFLWMTVNFSIRQSLVVLLVMQRGA